MELFQQISEVTKYNQGQHIHKLTDDNTRVYMIVTGEAKSIIHVDGSEVVGPLIEPGRLFGGLGLVRDNQKTLEVIAEQPTMLLTTSLRTISEFREGNPEEGTLLLQDILKRVQQFNAYIETSISKGVSEKSNVFIDHDEFNLINAPEDESSYIMAKSYKCPICRTVTESKVVRGTKIKMTATGDFFMNHYEPIEPLWYGFVTCNGCGFTERHESFNTPVKYDVEKIKDALDKVYTKGGITYSEPRTLKEVVNGYIMYEQTQAIRAVSERVMARGKLIIYEILIRAGFTEQANVYRDEAFEFYSGMFKSGILDVDDLQLQQLYLILGKLHEKREEYDEAKASYRNAKMIKGVEDPKFFELAEEFLIDLDNIS